MAVTARSVATVDDVVSLPQLRVLVMVASRGALNLSAVAAGLGVHPSNATRAVDRLVAAGLLDRRDDPSDRRNLILELSPDGRGLVDRVMEDRRAAIAEIVQRMPAQRRRSLVPVLRWFAAACGQVSEDAAWALGWTTAEPDGAGRPRSSPTEDEGGEEPRGGGQRDGRTPVTERLGSQRVDHRREDGPASEGQGQG